MFVNNIKTIFSGFRFGLLLQMAVGPIVLMALQTSGTLGLAQGFIFVVATTLCDALYIFLAGIGISAFLEKENVQRILKYVGGIVLIIFGLNIFLEVMGIKLIPSFTVNKSNVFDNIFIKGLIINLANPLVIIFWGGVFSSKIVENNYDKNQILLYGIGCLLSTFIFFSIVVIIGSIIRIVLTPLIINVLNCIVGICIILYGIKMLIKKGNV